MRSRIFLRKPGPRTEALRAIAAAQLCKEVKAEKQAGFDRLGNQLTDFSSARAKESLHASG